MGDLHIIWPQAGGLDTSAVRIMGLLGETVVLGIILIGVIVAVGSAAICSQVASHVHASETLADCSGHDTVQRRCVQL